MCKITSFKAKKGKNKYNTNGWQIKRSQYLKIHFTAIKTKTLIGYSKKVDFFIRQLDHMNFGPSGRAHFPFETIVYRPKSEVKQIRYHQNTKNPNKIFIFFFFYRKRDSFWPSFAQSTVPIGQEL